MPRYLLAVNFKGGVVETPMEAWKPEEHHRSSRLLQDSEAAADPERRAG
jgi:hypothetical protein